jgi:hypothetical protein
MTRIITGKVRLTATGQVQTVHVQVQGPVHSKELSHLFELHMKSKQS